MRRQPSQPDLPGGAYTLHLKVEGRTRVRVGSLGDVVLEAGNYVYVGSARKSIEGRIARHRRLANEKTGKLRWHIDYLLTHSGIELVGLEPHPGCRECDIARSVASLKGASAPVPRFGASDCRWGCAAHLFRVERSIKGKISPAAIQKGNKKL
ncbi:MAG: GIY-YIG nuclease family protein [Acidobacteria bacterium]|nr:GIY-YIG nuclease family protein [Acidobacteriota bacterium]